jgi:DNA replication ATP-dependent helicase Dna2
MSDPAGPLRLTASLIAQFFRFRCERQLRFEMVPERLRGAEVPARNSDPARGPLVGPRPGAGLLQQAGRRWERARLRTLVERAGEERVMHAGWGEHGAATLPVGRLVEALREPGSATLILQPELRLRDPRAFARRLGFDAAGVTLAPARPDVIRVRRTPDGRYRLAVLDIKASAEASVAHLAQIAFYSLLLEEICSTEGIHDARVDTRYGWVWSRAERRPRRFPLDAYRHHLRDFLAADLPRIAAQPPHACAWHLSPVCAGCNFFHHCHADADARDDLSRVPGITPTAKRLLRERGVETATQLAGSLRRETLGGSYALEARAPALQKRAQALRWKKVLDLESHSHLLAPSESIRALVSAEGDPVTGRCFALGLRIGGPAAGEIADGASEQVWLAERGSHAAEAAMLREWLQHLDALLMRVDLANRSARAERGNGRGSRSSGAGPNRGGARLRTLHLFVWDRGELDLLRKLLLRHLADAEVQPAVSRLLRAVSARGRMPDPEALRNPLGTVVVDVVSSLFALPVPYAYDLASVSERLQPEEGAWVHRPRSDYAWPLSSQVAFERIHNVWRRRPHHTSVGSEPPAAVAEQIRSVVLSKLRAIDSVLRAVRERTSRAAARRGVDPLQLHKEPFSLAKVEARLDDPALESLRVFTLLESATEALAARQLHSLPSQDRARRYECIRELHLVERRPDGQLLFEFDPACRDAKFRPGDFNLLLSNDNDRSLVELDRKPWDRRKLQVELVDLDARPTPPRLLLAPGPGFAKAEAEKLIDLGQVCVLDRAASDVNTRRVVATLRALDRGHGARELVRALLDGGAPDGWMAPFGGGTAEEVSRTLLAPLAAARGAAVLNREQEQAWRAVFQQPISLVWGPPGTGKTYLLAWVLLGLATAARLAGRPLRILVTAATHRAVVNVLVRLAREIEGAGIEAPLRAFKLRGSGNEADRDLEGMDVERIDDAALAGVLDAAEPGQTVVVGSTVWSLSKQMRAASESDEGLFAEVPVGEGEGEPAPVRSWFDVVVIDEASQMKVPEALIPASSLRSGGQLILCGDHRQLAPVVHGRYGAEAGTLFGSVFSHAAASRPLLALRESRRMNAALVEYPRAQFYPGLVSMCPEQRIRLAEVVLDDPMDRLLHEAFLDPDAAVVFCSYTGVRAGASNPFEAEIVARLIRLARRCLCDPATGEPLGDAAFVAHGLAVISPHRAQNSAIHAALRRQGLVDSETPVVDTVERMQGNEREMIVVSYGVADREYAEAEAEFLLDPNRFNVAITRARAKLVVFMSEEVLAALPREEPVLAGSMAIKAFPAHCMDEVREMELPGPGGQSVRARLRYRRLPV